jgi:hypothetical protein
MPRAVILRKVGVAFSAGGDPRAGAFSFAILAAFGALLTPAAVMASVLGLWRLAADMKWTGEFGISTGLFSHWQVWFGSAAILQWVAWTLNRYGRDHDQVRS